MKVNTNLDHNISNNGSTNLTSKNFLVEKGSMSNAIYKLLDDINIKQWSTINIKTIKKNKKREIWSQDIQTYEIEQEQEQEQEQEKKKKYKSQPTQNSLWEIFKESFDIIKQNHNSTIQENISHFLDTKNNIYPHHYTKKMTNCLRQNQLFIQDMVSIWLDKETNIWLSKLMSTHIEKVEDIKFNQLYQKFVVPDQNYYDEKLKSLNVLGRYKLYHFIDNIIIAEFLCQVLWIGWSNTLLIDNTTYHIYTAYF